MKAENVFHMLNNSQRKLVKQLLFQINVVMRKTFSISNFVFDEELLIS